MAKVNPKMAENILASIQDRRPPLAATPPGVRSSVERQNDGRRRLDGASLIHLDRIVMDPDQPRKEFGEEDEEAREALEQLAESIRARGQLQPIRVRWVESADRYMVVVGERRFRAARKAGLEFIACVVASADATPEDILEDQLVENALRMDLKPIEQARAYQRLMDSRGMSQTQLAELLHIGQASISRAVKLLELPGPIQAEVESGAIPPNIGYELSKIKDPAEQADMAGKAARGELRREEIQGRTRTPRKPRPSASPTRRSWPTGGGLVVTIEGKGGLDGAAILAALDEVYALIDAERPEDPR